MRRKKGRSPYWSGAGGGALRRSGVCAAAVGLNGKREKLCMLCWVHQVLDAERVCSAVVQSVSRIFLLGAA